MRSTDSALLHIDCNDIVFTTDGYVVDPVFFPGGNIGKLAVCGTVNDIAVTGAQPLYLSASFIIEEGFAFDRLEEIVVSMAAEAKKAGVLIVTGDTKVVNKGKCDKIFITTSGVGVLDKKFKHIAGAGECRPGDKIIVNGSLGNHGMAVMSSREQLHYHTPVESDCGSLYSLIRAVTEEVPVSFMRDATRGGLATVLVELCGMTKLGISLDEEHIPIDDSVRGICEVFGFDPLYVANEGKVVMVVPAAYSTKAVQIMQSMAEGKDAAVIGEITGTEKPRVILNTVVGGKRIMDMLAGEQLPRIC